MEGKLHPLRCQARFSELVSQHYQEAKEAKNAGTPIAWCVASVPTDIVRAFGYLPVYPETHSTTCGGRAAGTELCQVAERRGYSEELCSLAKADLGCYFAEGAGSPLADCSIFLYSAPKPGSTRYLVERPMAWLVACWNLRPSIGQQAELQTI